MKRATQKLQFLYFATFSMKSISHIFASFGTVKAMKLIEPISEIFYKDMLTFKISLPHR